MIGEVLKVRRAKRMLVVKCHRRRQRMLTTVVLRTGVEKPVINWYCLGQANYWL